MGSARFTGLSDHALTSVVLFLHIVRQLDRAGFNHMLTLLRLVKVDIQTYIQDQRKDESDMADRPRIRNPVNRAQPNLHHIILYGLHGGVTHHFAASARGWKPAILSPKGVTIVAQHVSPG